MSHVLQTTASPPMEGATWDGVGVVSQAPSLHSQGIPAHQVGGIMRQDTFCFAGVFKLH